MRQVSGEVHVQVTDRLSITEAIRILTGDPELVIVDFRVLRLLMGDLAGLIVLERLTDPEFHGFVTGAREPGEEPFAWDDESPCDP